MTWSLSNLERNSENPSDLILSTKKWIKCFLRKNPVDSRGKSGDITCSCSSATWDRKEQGCGWCDCFPPASGAFQVTVFWPCVHSYAIPLWRAWWPAIAGSVLRRIECWDEEKSPSFIQVTNEIYSFATEYDLPEATVNDLCAAVANVSINLMNLS